MARLPLIHSCREEIRGSRLDYLFEFIDSFDLRIDKYICCSFYKLVPFYLLSLLTTLLSRTICIIVVNVHFAQYTYCTHFHFFISRLREKKLRVCGAEVEWTLQKCGGGFEFTIKIIACHSLSPSFSPMKSIIFLSLAILSFSIMWMVNWCQIDQSLG